MCIRWNERTGDERHKKHAALGPLHSVLRPLLFMAVLPSSPLLCFLRQLACRSRLNEVKQHKYHLPMESVGFRLSTVAYSMAGKLSLQCTT